jgi:membrane-associated phospholipid phosphatase
MNIDHKLSHLFFKTARQSWIGRHLAVAASTHLIWLMIGVVVAVNSWNHLGYEFVVDGDVLVFFILLLPAWMVTMILSKLINRERPYLELKVKPLIDPFVHTASFPSAHATIAFSILFLSLEFTGLLPYMLGAAILVALGRVATGVHFFSDVIVGGAIGYFVTYASQIAFLLLLLAGK